MIRFFKYILH